MNAGPDIVMSSRTLVLKAASGLERYLSCQKEHVTSVHKLFNTLLLLSSGTGEHSLLRPYHL